MAGVQAAIDYMLSWEDATLSGTITVAADGKRTRFGIDEHFHPELTNTLYFGSMGKDAAMKIASAIYDLQYCQPLCIAEISDQQIANKLLSLGVNCGVVTVAKMLQQVLGVAGDGRIGPLTLDKLDRTDSDLVIEGLRQAAEKHYEALIARNPSFAVYRAGWLRRADA